MDGQNQINAQRLLMGVVPDEIFASYSKLLAEDGCQESDAASLLGSDEQAAELTVASTGVVYEFDLVNRCVVVK
ncbi:hypothetical protein GCM10010176_104030 [Nonomuraea spiralis]|nr:hypothetical protein GCM10010176_104030 [Nonomuraea spiralis]